MIWQGIRIGLDLVQLELSFIVNVSAHHSFCTYNSKGSSFRAQYVFFGQDLANFRSLRISIFLRSMTYILVARMYANNAAYSLF